MRGPTGDATVSRNPGPPESELRRGRQLAPRGLPGRPRAGVLAGAACVQSPVCPPRFSGRLRGRLGPSVCPEGRQPTTCWAVRVPAEFVRPTLNVRRQVAELRTAGPWGLGGRGATQNSRATGDWVEHAQGEGLAPCAGARPRGLCCRHRPLLPSFRTPFTGTHFLAHVRCVPDSAPL